MVQNMHGRKIKNTRMNLIYFLYITIKVKFILKCVLC